jgi:signal transduction histidine kinase
VVAAPGAPVPDANGCQTLALAFLLKTQTDTSTAERWELHSKEVISRTAQLEMTLNQAHAATRGASVYETLDFEKDRRDALLRWPATLADLRRFVADNPGQQAQIDRIRRAAGPYLAWFAAMERLGAGGQWDAYRAEPLTAHGKTLMDAVEDALANFTGEEERLDRQRMADVAASRLRERNVLLIIAGLAVVLAIGLLFVFTRGFSLRLSRIAVNGQRLATGERLLDALPGNDELAGLDAVLHDSAQRLAAAAAAEKRYATELEERGRALEQANKDLLFRRQENEMFVYSVSHDLRSPLVNVQGFTQELTRACEELRDAIGRVAAPERDRLERIVDSDIGEAISFIQTAVSRLSGIVDALLRLSRAGRVEFASQRVELGPIVERIIRAMRATIEQRQAEVVSDALPARRRSTCGTTVSAYRSATSRSCSCPSNACTATP